MSKRSTVVAVLAVLAAAVTFAVARPDVSAAAGPVRIMPLGDSITGSPGCWRSMLWNRLQSTGYTDIDFVGTLPPQGCGQAHDGNNEGHGGALATTVANENLLTGWLSATLPDVVLMHFGTNDVWSNRPTATILDAYTKLVQQMRASNPRMKILVAKIIPMDPSSCGECGQRTVALNNAIPGWAATATTSQSPIVVVDQWTGFSTATDTYDGVHPNSAGDTKMANRWYPALTAALNSTPTPPANTTAPATPTPASPTPPANTTAPASPTPGSTGPTGPAACTASYTVTGQWQGGFQGEVTVRNTGTATLNGWSVRFQFAGGQRVIQSWNASVTQVGDQITARPASWNASLATGQSAAWGFIASSTTATAAPVASCSAG